MRYSQCCLFLCLLFIYFVAYKLLALSLLNFEKLQFHFYGFPGDVYVGLPSFVQITQQHLPARGIQIEIQLGLEI